MLTHPPASFYANGMPPPGVLYPHRVPYDTNNANLLRLMNLSSQLPDIQDGELTPVAALAIIRGDPRYGHLTLEDFKTLTKELKDRCRCYG